jgi:hypothetical protein
MRPEDAVAFFQAQGIRGAEAEIRQACERYGCHPLSLRLLALHHRDRAVFAPRPPQAAARSA